jgi:hypothetical protein
MRKKTPPTEFVNADQFKDPKNGWIYRFPIQQVLHPRFGRMEVEVEPVIKRGVIRALRIGFSQHEIEALKSFFEIPTPQADKGTVLTSRSGGGSFFAGVWSVGVCQEHKLAFLNSYAPDGASALVIECLSISIGIHYALSDRT